VALNRYVVTSAVTLASDALTAGTGGWGNSTGTDAAGAYDTCGPQVIPPGTVIIADPAGKLFTAIGSGNLRAFVPGQDDVGHAAISN
jgi:hypothetical protein